MKKVFDITLIAIVVTIVLGLPFSALFFIWTWNVIAAKIVASYLALFASAWIIDFINQKRV